ncbi:Asp23/Gls24 family envelope stress response protein [Pseudonocardia spirodelae]|uniref:Asp23/Gls24 family envelope stress response protein n=1 Tax=Pseudonocardia spirodelae TaxID=3133431 RepID=A0ABU8T7F7_9PSEU
MNALPAAGGAPVAAGGIDTDRIADAVLSCPGVAQLHAGRFGEIATYLPGRRVSGIRVDPTAQAVEIHVVGRYPASVAAIADQVRAAVLPVVGDTRVDVVVGDYAGPAETAPIRRSDSAPATGEIEAPPATHA